MVGSETKVITPANHKGHRQYGEPIKTQVNWKRAKSHVMFAFTSDWMKKVA